MPRSPNSHLAPEVLGTPSLSPSPLRPLPLHAFPCVSLRPLLKIQRHACYLQRPQIQPDFIPTNYTGRKRVTGCLRSFKGPCAALSRLCRGTGSVWVRLLPLACPALSPPAGTSVGSDTSRLFRPEGKAAPSQPLWAAIRERVSSSTGTSPGSSGRARHAAQPACARGDLLPDTSLERWLLLFFLPGKQH